MPSVVHADARPLSGPCQGIAVDESLGPRHAWTCDGVVELLMAHRGLDGVNAKLDRIPDDLARSLIDWAVCRDELPGCPALGVIVAESLEGHSVADDLLPHLKQVVFDPDSPDLKRGVALELAAPARQRDRGWLLGVIARDVHHADLMAVIDAAQEDAELMDELLPLLAPLSVMSGSPEVRYSAAHVLQENRHRIGVGRMASLFLILGQACEDQYIDSLAKEHADPELGDMARAACAIPETRQLVRPPAER